MRNEKLEIMIYNNWKIEKNEVGYYEANRLDNSNENYLHAKTIDSIKIEIDEAEMESFNPTYIPNN